LPDIRNPPGPAAPPPAPDLPRRVRVNPSQWVGLPLLLLVPVLALGGVLGERRQLRTMHDDHTRIEVEYPTRLRARQHSTVVVRIVKLNGTSADSVRVMFDESWLGRFDDVDLTPDPQHGWTVLLADFEVGEQVEVRLGLEAGRPGRSRGQVRVEGGARAGHEIVLSTFVLP
jgi:hypothetical protein